MFLLFDLGLQTLAIYVLAAIVPAISLLVYIYRHDKIEQEPISLLSWNMALSVLYLLV